MAVASEQPDAFSILLDDQAIPVMLDLMNPVGTSRNLGGTGWNAGFEGWSGMGV
jgi:hypothetical protein